MKKNELDADIKVRVPKAHKTKLKDIAKGRGLKLSDIGRSAFVEFLARHKRTKAGK